DVDATNHQNDQAAARLFDASTLSFVTRHFPDYQGLASLLKVFGGLFTAWKDPKMGHLERIQLAFRARVFLTGWRTHVTGHRFYSTTTQFLSPFAYDSFLSLCDALVLLILVYRDYFPTHPLLPWLHSTEPCERIFAMLRKHRSNFNHSNFLQFMSK
ncbi:hypothetical protein BOTBODRAFT_89502, partial [Botryobasidium botryosum FD-172 SS1]